MTSLRLHHLLGMVLLLLVPVVTQADTGPITGHLEDPVFLSLPNKTTLDDKNPLDLYFSIDKEACRKQYGDRYYSGCRRNLKLAGKTVRRGISITPQISGEWRWENDYHLRFTPHEPWLADQEYKAVFDKSAFPVHVSLNKDTYTFRSRRFQIRVPEMKFFQDPDNPARKVVATRMTFNYPVDKSTLEPRTAFSFHSRDGNKSLPAEDRFPFEITYNPQGTEANLITPLSLLPDKEKFLQLVVDAGVQPRGQTRPSKRAFSERVRVPSLDDYYRVNSVRLSLVKNDRFGTDQVLVLDTNVKATPEEVAGHLEVYLLPEFHPVAEKNPDNKRPYHWKAANEVSEKILQASEKLDALPLPVSEEHSALHSLKLDTEPGRYVYLKLRKGVKAFGGFSMSRDYDTIVRVPQFPRELSIMQAGGLLALSGEKKISVLARGLDGVRFEVAQVLPQFLSHLVTQTRGDFASPYFKSYSFDQKNIAEIANEELSLFREDDKAAQFTSFDFAPYLKEGKKGLFFIRIFGTRGKNTQVARDQRFILVTDLGFLVKRNAQGTREVFVQSISTGQPVGGAEVRILGNNGQPVFSAVTNGEGRASVPNLTGMSPDRLPVAVTVSKGNDLSFMAYDRYDRRLDLSRFPVSGRYIPADGLQAFVFSDRGIYRPGDSVNFGMIVKARDWTKDLEGVPLELNIIDPRGVAIVKESIRLSASGFEEYRFQTEPNFPVGRYHAHLYITNDGKRGSLLHSTSVRVEEFLPDRMKIRADFTTPRRKGWQSPENLQVRVNLKNLYGTPATNRRVKATLSLSPAGFSFADYADYRFFNAFAPTGGAVTEALPEARTDENGDAVFDLDLSRYGRAGFFASFRAEGFEAGGGRSVAVETATLVSSMQSVVGYKTGSNLNYLKNDRQHRLHWIALDPDLNPVAKKGLTLSVIRKDAISTLVKRNGQFAYESVPRERVVETKTVDIGTDGLDWNLDTSRPGDFALVLTDAEGTDVSRVDYSVAGEAHVAGRLDTRSELKIKLDKTYYEAGDEIELNIVAPYTGAGLITIESDRVHAHKWFATDKTDSIQRIRLPEGFEGNGFVNVAFTRALGAKEIYMSPLAYAVAPFTANIEKRRVKIDLKMPERARPGRTFPIQVSTGRSSRVVVFAVDEGILQVAQYKTPRPLDYFLKGRALAVDTTQILDLLMAEYSQVREASAPGGGMSAIGGKHLNPFRRKTDAPVVYWSGILGADERSQTLTWDVPPYFNGTLRVMAVAVSGDGVGATEQKALVQGDYVISPNAPVFAAPGDTFEVTATIANNLEGSGAGARVPVTVTPSEHLSLTGTTPESMTIDEGREETLRFQVKANEVLGSAALTFTAGEGEHAARYTATLSVRPSLPKMTRLDSGYMEGKEKTVALQQNRYPEFAETEAGVSALPAGLIGGLLRFLENFPHGCTEQTVSRNYPAIVLARNPDFDFDDKRIAEHIQHAVDRLRVRQTADGGFDNWISGGTATSFPSVYALDFLTDVREKGFPVPTDLYRRGLDYLKDMVNRDIRSLDDARVKAYGVYVLTRNGEVTTNYITHLLHYIEKHPKWAWDEDLAMIYLAAAFKMMQQDALADPILDTFKVGRGDPWTGNSYYNGLIKYSRYVTLLARHFPERLKLMDRDVIFRIANYIGEGRYSTLSSSYAIQALADYTAAVGGEEAGDLAIAAETSPGQFAPLALTGQAVKRAVVAGFPPALKFSGSGEHGLFYQVALTGFEQDLPAERIGQGLEISRRYLDKDGNPVKTARVGEDLEVVLTLHSLENKTLENIAVVELLPGGFDLGKPPEGGDASTLGTQFVDRREDRIVIYATVTPNEETFRYTLRATNKGTFTLPPAYAESMYDSEVKARSLAGSLTVE